MIQCWNCLRPSDGVETTCAFCGAALAKYGPPVPVPAPAPEPAPEPAPVPPPRPLPGERRPPRGRKAQPERADYVLQNPASLRERAQEATAFHAETAAKSLGSLARLAHAFHKNSRSGAVLAGCVSIVALIALSATAPPPGAKADAPSMAAAVERGQYYAKCKLSVDQVAWNGNTVSITEAWIGKLGTANQAGAAADPGAQYRLYFRLSTSPGPASFDAFTGVPPRRIRAVVVVDQGVSRLLHYLDLLAPLTAPITITLRDPAHPEFGRATFSVQ